MVTFFLDDRPAPKKWFDMHWRPQNPCILSRMIIIIYKRQRERIVKQRKNRIFYQTNKDNCVIIYLWKRESEQSLVWSGDKALETGGAGHGCQGCLAPAEFLYSNVWHPLILAILLHNVALHPWILRIYLQLAPAASNSQLKPWAYFSAIV